MDIIKQIIDNPMDGLVLLGFVLALSLILAGLVWGLLAGIRWATRDRRVKLPLGIELNDEVPDGSAPAGSCPSTDEILTAIEGAVWIVSKVEGAKRSIVTAQKDAIASRRGEFYNALSGRRIPPGFARIFLVEFEDVFQLAAEYNHVAEHVSPDTGFIDKDYLDRKLVSLGSRYVSTQKELSTDPALASPASWLDVEPMLREVSRMVLYDFATLAEVKKKEVTEDIQAIKDKLGVSEAIGIFIDKIVTKIK